MTSDINEACEAIATIAHCLTSKGYFRSDFLFSIFLTPHHFLPSSVCKFFSLSSYVNEDCYFIIKH